MLPYNASMITSNTHQDGTSPLLAACERGHTEIAQILIYNGADFDLVDVVSVILGKSCL